MKRAIATAVAAAVLPLTVTQAAAQAELQPTTACAVQIQPGAVLIVAGHRIVWGAQHGVARVHATVWVDPPTLPDGMSASYTWKVGTTYTVAGSSYRFGWSAYGRRVVLKVLLSGRCGGFAKYYDFGTVGLPA